MKASITIGKNRVNFNGIEFTGETKSVQPATRLGDNGTYTEQGGEVFDGKGAGEWSRVSIQVVNGNVTLHNGKAVVNVPQEFDDEADFNAWFNDTKKCLGVK